jgi:hypothetical protein
MDVIYVIDDQEWDPVDVNPLSDAYVTIIQKDDTTSSGYKHKKRRKLNPPGENMWLRPDGSILSEMDIIIKLQRRVRERLWKPDGVLAQRLMRKYKPLFAADSFMGLLWQDVWETKQLENKDPDDRQMEYERFCRDFKLNVPCWEPIGPYPIPEPKSVLENNIADDEGDSEQRKQNRLERAQIEYWDQLLE